MATLVGRLRIEPAYLGLCSGRSSEEDVSDKSALFCLASVLCCFRVFDVPTCRVLSSNMTAIDARKDWLDQILVTVMVEMDELKKRM
jgi:hypothetical protein